MMTHSRTRKKRLNAQLRIPMSFVRVKVSANVDHVFATDIITGMSHNIMTNN